MFWAKTVLTGGEDVVLVQVVDYLYVDLLELFGNWRQDGNAALVINIGF
jgi:hypothetical protein